MSKKYEVRLEKSAQKNLKKMDKLQDMRIVDLESNKTTNKNLTNNNR